MTEQTQTRCTLAQSNRVGLVAGWGNFPVELVEHWRCEGKEVYVAAIKAHADPRLADLATDLRWFGVAKIGKHQDYFKKNGISEVALAGKLFKHRILHHGLGWLQHVPDIRCIKTLSSIFLTRRKDARDDTILSAIVDSYQARDIRVMSITEVAPQLLAQDGCLTASPPSLRQDRDIQFGWQIARQMGGLDIGQSITVKDQMVLGVEAIEGTDALIERTGKLCPRGGFTLIKVAKPQQDMRFDVPTVGLRTVKQMIRAGGTCIAIESARTIVLDREATLSHAEQHGIALVSLTGRQRQHTFTPPEVADQNAQNGSQLKSALPSSKLLATNAPQQSVQLKSTSSFRAA